MSANEMSHRSVEAVKAEIFGTIDQTELSLERFHEDRDSSEDLQNCIDSLNQLRGIYVIINVQGCMLLCQEAVSLGNDVPVGANADKDGLLTSLNQALFYLRRYTEYFYQTAADVPEILLPIINQIREARKEPLLSDAHFAEISAFSVDISDLIPVKSLDDEAKVQWGSRVRHMYQIALLDLLRGKNEKIALRLISRAALGCAKLISDDGQRSFWLLAMVTANAMVETSQSVTKARKRIFMRIEKHLRDMVVDGHAELNHEVESELRTELLYILATGGSGRSIVSKILDRSSLEPIAPTDAEINSERNRLFGPGPDTLKSLTDAIVEEMVVIKSGIDRLGEDASFTDETMEDVVSRLEQLKSIFSLLELPHVSALCSDQAETVEKWRKLEGPPDDAGLLHIADALIKVEQVANQFETSGLSIEDDFVNPGKAQGLSPFYSEALVLVIDESQAALTLARKSIHSFIESEGDKVHVASIRSVIGAVQGSMVMIDEPRIAAILHKCGECIQEQIIESTYMPNESILESLADSLSSVEYYIESMKYRNSTNPELLSLSEESLKSVGYSIS